MKIAYLGPFVTNRLLPYIESLNENDCKKSPGMGGFGFVDLVENRNLYSQNDISVLTLDTNLSNDKLIRNGRRCSLYALPRRSSGAIRDLYSFERKILNSVIDDIKPDIIHAHWTYEYALSIIDSKVPHVVTAHDHPAQVLKYSGKYYLPHFLITHYIYMRSKYITGVSPAITNYISKWKKGGVFMVPNPLSPNLRNLAAEFNRDYEYDIPIITTVADFNELKNPCCAIKGFNGILTKYSTAELHLFGKGMEPGGIAEKWCKKNGLVKNVFFHGKVNNNVLLEFLLKSTLLLFTSHFEGFGMPVAEAMSVGLPIIAGQNSGGVTWLMDNGQAGLLVDITKSDEISEAIIKYLQNKKLRHDYGCKSKERVIDLLDPVKISSQYDHIYELAISRTSKS